MQAAIASGMRTVVQKPFRVALCQMLVTADKQVNLAKARSLAVDAAMKGGAKVVVLPECFNSPYGVKYFRSYAEHIPEGESTAALRDIAREAGVVLVGGSIPEKDTAGKLYNTCLVFDGDGTGNHAATSVPADADWGTGSGSGGGGGSSLRQEFTILRLMMDISKGKLSLSTERFTCSTLT